MAHRRPPDRRTRAEHRRCRRRFPRGPAGLDRDETFECGITAEQRVTCVTRYLGDDPSLDDDAHDAYVAAFWEWLSAADPDTYATIESSDGQIPGSQGDPDQMTITLSVLDDFLAQSDRYPQQ